MPVTDADLRTPQQDGTDWYAILDVCYEGYEDLDSGVREYGESFGIERHEILQRTGPAGGWPVVKYVGTYNQIKALLDTYFADN